MKQLAFLTLSILNILFVKGQQIIDNGKFLKDTEITDLTDRMNQINKHTTAQILVYTTIDLGGLTSKEYTNDLWKKYPAGLKGINNGIIMLLSKNDRKLQISPGFGLEWILSDVESKKIVDEMIPYFKKQEFYNGIKTALNLINIKISNIDWTVNPRQLNKISAIDTGKLLRIEYSNKTGNTKYKYAIDVDPQFSDDFKIVLSNDKDGYDLYYSKYMNDMIAKILTKSNIVIYARLIDWNNKKLKLIGTE